MQQDVQPASSLSKSFHSLQTLQAERKLFFFPQRICFHYNDEGFKSFFAKQKKRKIHRSIEKCYKAKKIAVNDESHNKIHPAKTPTL